MPHTYRAVIKGNTTQAIYAAQSRGFAITGILQNGKPDGSGNTILRIEHSDEDQVVHWLTAEPKQPPFPPGSLLFYQDESSDREFKKAWIAPHDPGYKLNDDLDGLAEDRPEPIKTYTVGDIIYEVVEPKTKQRHKYIIRIWKKIRPVPGHKNPHLVWSDVVYESDVESAVLAGARNAANVGDITSGDLVRLRDAVREQRHQGFKMDDDLEGLGGYEIFVGNIGKVADATYITEARKIFEDYVEFSKHGKGRAAGESVALLHEGEILDEYHPPPEGYKMEDDLEGFGEFHPWSVSTLVPGLHDKPKYMYFDDFKDALAYARDRARKGKRVRDGGRAYFILDNAAGGVTHRVIRANLGAEQRSGQHYVEKREFVLVQKAEGTVAGHPDRTRWVTDKSLSVEILDQEVEKARKNMPPRGRQRRETLYTQGPATKQRGGDAEDRAAVRLAELRERGIEATYVVRTNGTIAIRLPDGSTEEV